MPKSRMLEPLRLSRRCSKSKLGAEHSRCVANVLNSLLRIITLALKSKAPNPLLFVHAHHFSVWRAWFVMLL